MLLKLRPYQQAAVESIRARLSAGINRQLVSLPTGTGKTPLFSALPNELGFDGRMLVLVHREELAAQAADKLRKWNPGTSVGIEKGKSRADHERFVVASVQTLGRKGSQRLQRFAPGQFDAVVIDECHHALAKSYRRILEHLRVWQDTKRLCLGVTATASRADRRDLSEVFQEIVHDMSLLDAIRQGWLVDLRAKSIKATGRLGGVHTRAGDFATEQLSLRVNTPERNELIARSWLEHGENRRTVVFAVDVSHAREIAAAFRQYGVAAEAVWGGDPDRCEKLTAHRAGQLRVLVNCQILTEGYDDPAVSCIGMARPTKSETLYRQMIGRGTRLPAGVNNLTDVKSVQKRDCLLLDFVDVVGRHKLVNTATLFGFSRDLDFQGRSVSAVAQRVREIKTRKPYLELTKLDDISKLDYRADWLWLSCDDLLPDVLQLGGAEWRKVGRQHYALKTGNAESVEAWGDLRGKWYVRGLILGAEVRGVFDCIDSACRFGTIHVIDFAS